MGHGLTFCYNLDKWLSSVDLFTAMGFPITEECQAACGHTQCQFSRGQSETKPNLDLTPLNGIRWATACTSTPWALSAAQSCWCCRAWAKFVATDTAVACAGSASSEVTEVRSGGNLMTKFAWLFLQYCAPVCRSVNGSNGGHQASCSSSSLRGVSSSPCEPQASGSDSRRMPACRGVSCSVQ